MKRFQFSGGSDDLLGVSGAMREELCGYDKRLTYILIDRSNPHHSVYINGVYSPNTSGGWSIGVEPRGEHPEDHEPHMPPWSFSFVACEWCAYSPCLAVECPDTVECVTLEEAADE